MLQDEQIQNIIQLRIEDVSSLTREMTLDIIHTNLLLNENVLSDRFDKISDLDNGLNRFSQRLGIKGSNNPENIQTGEYLNFIETFLGTGLKDIRNSQLHNLTPISV